MDVRYLLLFCLLVLGRPGFAQTSRISDFDELMSSLNSGGQVRVIIQFARCVRADENEKQNPIPDASAGMEIDTYEYFAAGAIGNQNPFVVFSTTKLIQNPKGKGFVLNYGKVRINSDNTAVVTTRYIHPKSYRVLMDEKYACKLNDGKNQEGINLYKNP